MYVQGKHRTAHSNHSTMTIVEGSIVTSTIVPPRKRFPVPFLLLCFVLTGASLVGFAMFANLQAHQQTTVFLQPLQQQRTATITVSSLPHVTSADTLTASRTVQATGHQYQAAARASGSLLFYNQEPYAQTLPAGLIISISTPLQATLTGSVVIPAGQPPVSGEASALASIVQTGAPGNVAASTLHGACSCGGASGISVSNLAFHGGQDAATRTIVQESDITTVVAEGKAHRLQTALRHLQQQVPAREQLAAPPTCADQVQVDHPVGSVATQVSIAITTTCRAVTFALHGIQQQAIAAFLTQFGHVPSAYRLSHVVARFLSLRSQNTPVTLRATFDTIGTWLYQMSSRECRALREQLAGKPYEQALQILTTHNGVATATIEPVGQPLPEDSALILLRFPAPSPETEDGNT